MPFVFEEVETQQPKKERFVFDPDLKPEPAVKTKTRFEFLEEQDASQPQRFIDPVKIAEQKDFQSKIPTPEEQALKDPLVDPFPAFVAGATGGTSLALRGGAKVLPALGRGLAEGIPAAVGDVLVGQAADVASEEIDERLGLPFAIIGGVLTGATIERSVSKKLVKAFSKSGVAPSAEVVKDLSDQVVEKVSTGKFKEADELIERFKKPGFLKTAEDLVEERVAKTRIDKTITEGTGIGIEDLPPLTEPRLSGPVNKNIAAAAEEIFTVGGIARDRSKKITEQVAELLGSDKLPLQELNRILKEKNLSLEQFTSGIFGPSISDFGRQLGRWGVLQRKLNSRILGADKETREGIQELVESASELDEMTKAAPWWKRVDNIRRGLMVSQLSTAVRNAVTQGGRIGIDIVDQAIQSQLQKTFNVKGGAKIKPLDGFEVLLDIVRPKKTKKAVESILEFFPKEHNRLLGSYMSDIAVKMDRGLKPAKASDKVFKGVEKAVSVLNTANRFQEFVIRRAVFATRLDQSLRKKGLDLAEIAANNTIEQIDPSDIRTAVNEALEVTFAEAPKFGSVAKAFVDFVNKVPGATLAIPFPRFLVNSLKFQYQFSPFGMLSLMGKEARDAVAGGDMKVFSRAAIGSAMLTTAWQMRNSEFGGDETKYWEAKLPDGRIADLRPFNPFVGYLFMAEILRKAKEDKLDSLTTKDFVIGLASVNVRAGTGVFLMDSILDGLRGTATDKRIDALKRFAGEAVAGFAVPIQQLQDVMAQFDESEATLRERRAEPFKGPTKVKIPGVSKSLPEARRETRVGPITKKDPLLKQLTGLIIKDPRNSVENAIVSLGVNFGDFAIRTGDVNVNFKAKELMAKGVESNIIPLVESKKFKNLPRLRQKLVLINRLRAERNKAIGQIKKTDLKFREKEKVRGLDKTLRQIIERSKRR